MHKRGSSVAAATNLIPHIDENEYESESKIDFKFIRQKKFLGTRTPLKQNPPITLRPILIGEKGDESDTKEFKFITRIALPAPEPHKILP